MNNKELDQLFKDKLSQQTEDLSHSDWDVFSKLLKESEGFENIDLDKTIKTSLSKHTVPYNENHWHLLKNRLLKEENLRKKLFTAKAIESILLLLVLLVFQNYDNQLFKQSVGEKIATPYAINHIPQKSTSGIISANSSDMSLRHKSHIDMMAYALSAEAYNSRADLSPAFVENTDQRNESTEESVNPTNSVTTKMNELPMTPTEAIHSVSNEIISTPTIATVVPLSLQDRKTTSKYITASVSGGLGIARSAYDPIYNINGYNTYSSQYGIGLLYSVKNKKFEVQSGVRYTKKKYEPSKLRETYGSLYNGYKEIQLDEISYDIVDVPLSVKYFFKEGKSFSAFVKAGVNANFSLANKYIVSSTYTPPLSINTYAAKLEISDGKDLDPSTKLSQKDFNPGLLQDNSSHSFLSSLGENTFFTVSAELGLEKKFTNNDAFVFGLEYNKYYKIEGMGPNKDKLSALTINLGLKHHIN